MMSAFLLLCFFDLILVESRITNKKFLEKISLDPVFPNDDLLQAFIKDQSKDGIFEFCLNFDKCNCGLNSLTLFNCDCSCWNIYVTTGKLTKLFCKSFVNAVYYYNAHSVRPQLDIMLQDMIVLVLNPDKFDLNHKVYKNKWTTCNTTLQTFGEDLTKDLAKDGIKGLLAGLIGKLAVNDINPDINTDLQQQAVAQASSDGQQASPSPDGQASPDGGQASPGGQAPDGQQAVAQASPDGQQANPDGQQANPDPDGQQAAA